MFVRLAAVAILLLACLPAHAQHANLRDYGIRIGVLQPGEWNAITDVPGVLVGQTMDRHSTLLRAAHWSASSWETSDSQNEVQPT